MNHFLGLTHTQPETRTRDNANYSKAFLCFIVAVVAMLLAGCSGSSDSTSSTITSPRVVIDWPKLTRGIQAPAYANSAVISITPSSALSPTTWTVDRPAGTAPQTFTYSGPKIPYAVPAVLIVTFKSGSGGTGSTVASASVTVKVLSDGTLQKEDGTALGTISYATALTSLEISVKDMAINSAQTVSVIGRNEAGVVALPQALVNLSIIEHPETVTLTDAALIGVSEGTPKIQASFDGLTSATTFTVTPEIAFHFRLDLKANYMTADPGRPNVWLSFGANSAYPNSIVPVNLLTRNIGTPISVGSEPGKIAISADGTRAYVAINGASSIRVVDLDLLMAGAMINFENVYPSGTVADIRVNPADRNEFAVCLASSNGEAPFKGPYVYRNGTLINVIDPPGQYPAAAVEWTGAESLVGYQSGVSGDTVHRFLVKIDGVELVNSVGSATLHHGDVSLAGNNMYFNNGDAFSTADLSFAGTLAFGQETYDQIATDSNGNQAWATVDGSYPRKIRCFDLAGMTSQVVKALPFESQKNEHVIQIARYGNFGLAVLSSEHLYLMDTAPGL